MHYKSTHIGLMFPYGKSVNPEIEFESNASLEKGISGQLKIDSNFENNEPLETIHPRNGDSDD